MGDRAKPLSLVPTYTRGSVSLARGPGESLTTGESLVVPTYTRISVSLSSDRWSHGDQVTAALVVLGALKREGEYGPTALSASSPHFAPCVSRRGRQSRGTGPCNISQLKAARVDATKLTRFFLAETTETIPLKSSRTQRYCERDASACIRRHQVFAFAAGSASTSGSLAHVRQRCAQNRPKEPPKRPRFRRIRPKDQTAGPDPANGQSLDRALVPGTTVLQNVFQVGQVACEERCLACSCTQGGAQAMQASHGSLTAWVACG